MYIVIFLFFNLQCLQFATKIYFKYMFEYHMSSYMHRLCKFGQVLVFTVCGHKYTYIEYYYQLKWIFIHLYIIGTVYKYHRYDI